MPLLMFEGTQVELPAASYDRLMVLCPLLHTEDDIRNAILDVLFDEGLLCDVCGEALATQHGQYHEDVSVCAACAQEEPEREEDGTPPCTEEQGVVS